MQKNKFLRVKPKPIPDNWQEELKVYEILANDYSNSVAYKNLNDPRKPVEYKTGKYWGPPVKSEYPTANEVYCYFETLLQAHDVASAIETSWKSGKRYSKYYRQFIIWWLYEYTDYLFVLNENIYKRTDLAVCDALVDYLSGKNMQDCYSKIYKEMTSLGMIQDSEFNPVLVQPIAENWREIGKEYLSKIDEFVASEAFDKLEDPRKPLIDKGIWKRPKQMVYPTANDMYCLLEMVLNTSEVAEAYKRVWMGGYHGEETDYKDSLTCQYFRAWWLSKYFDYPDYDGRISSGIHSFLGEALIYRLRGASVKESYAQVYAEMKSGRVL